MVIGQHASKRWEKNILSTFAFIVYWLLINNAVGSFSGRDRRDLFGEWQSRGRDRDDDDNEHDAPSIGMRGSMLVLEISEQVLLRRVEVELSLHAIRNHQACIDSILKHHNGGNYHVLRFLEVAWNYLQESINETVILVKYSGINRKKKVNCYMAAP